MTVKFPNFVIHLLHEHVSDKMTLKLGAGALFGICEEQLPTTDCRPTVGQQLTDRLPTCYRQMANTEMFTIWLQFFPVKIHFYVRWHVNVPS